MMANGEIPAALAEARERIAKLREERAAVLDKLAGAHGDEREALLAELADLDEAFRGVLDDLEGAGVDPCDAEAEVPLVLLPVRLETRFTEGQDQLRVRIYPDDVHVDRLDEGLRKREREAGQAYWTAVWAGDEEAEGVAWRALQQAVHRGRAAWVARALTPLNLGDRPAAGANGPDPEFPDTPGRRLGPPVARALPDRFVVRVEQGGEVNTVAGAPIAPERVVGLAGHPDPAGVLRHDGVTLGRGMEWMVDYNRAVEEGLAVTVDLPLAGKPVDSVLAFGVGASLDAAAGAGELEGLLTAHRYTRGAAIVPQGTPTNNTESDRSGWQRRPEERAPAIPAPGTQLPDDANAAVLARALGIDVETLRGVDHSDEREQGKARAANTALWAPSWGAYLDRFLILMKGAEISDDQREALRDLFQDHVRGRGPLPALRLGDQPYGVLPVSAHDSRWQPDEDSLEPGLTALLRSARGILRASVGGLPRVSDGPLDDALLEILGSSPRALGLRVRSVASVTMSKIGPKLIPIGGTDTELQGDLDWMLWAALGFELASLFVKGTLGKTTRPLGLPLVDESDPEYIKHLLDGTPRPEIRSVLQALLELADDAEVRAVDAASPPPDLVSLVRASASAAGDLEGPIARLVRAASQGNGAAGIEPEVFGKMADQVAARAGGESGPSLLAEYEQLAAVRGSLAEVALATEDSSALAFRALGAWFRAQARRRDFLRALDELGTTTLDERRLLLCEVLDTASHRLDAWITAVVSRRLDAKRATQPDGAMIGAYGWIEDLVPGATTTPAGGYIHAPTPAQATTAGILRSAHLTHNGGGAGQGAFAIDLTSARVRTAVGLAEGIAQGQPLGALLGYRFERRLHEDGLDRFVLSIRALAPLVAGKLTDHGTTLPAPAQETVAATNVVDGARLSVMDRDEIKDALKDPPANNPYLDPDDWEFDELTDWPQIETALDEIAAANDSLADLMLAEGVHQLAQGNMARASAALGAAAGDAPPVEFEFARTQPTGLTLTHRLMLVAPDGAAGSEGWNEEAPRAVAEPRLERWAERRLGPAGAVVLATGEFDVSITLGEAGISALDLVYDAGQPRALERRIRAAIPALGDAELTERLDEGWPAGTISWFEALEHAAALGRMLAVARPAMPAAFARTSDLDPEHPRTVAPEALTDLEARVGHAVDSLELAAQELRDALEGGQDPHEQLAGLAGYGVYPPAGAKQTGKAGGPTALAEAERRVSAARLHLDGAPPAQGQPPHAAPEFTAQLGIDAGKAIFGDSFWALPLVPGAGAALGSSPAAPLPTDADLRRFLHDAASVRAEVAGYTEALLIAEAIGAECDPAVAQLTGADEPVRWVGKPFDSARLARAAPITSIVFDSAGPVPAGADVAGLVVDEWLETVPRWRRREQEDGTKVRELVQTTGLAVNANAPGARAPQAILLAVSPDGRRWSTDSVAATLDETRDLARLRGVTLERAVWLGRILPALYEQSWSLQGEKTLDIRYLAEHSILEAMLPFVTEAGGA